MAECIDRYGSDRIAFTPERLFFFNRLARCNLKGTSGMLGKSPFADQLRQGRRFHTEVLSVVQRTLAGE